MIIGIPKEIKNEEFRVAITPAGVRKLEESGHTILIETNAGAGSGFSDDEYLAANADIVDKKLLFSRSELVVKVNEPLPEEYPLFREGQAVFTYLHLAPNQQLTEFLLQKKITGLAHETLKKDGTLPLLAPISEIAEGHRSSPGGCAWRSGTAERGSSFVVPRGFPRPRW